MPDAHNLQPDVPSPKDQLGFDTYVTTITNMIVDPTFQTPFCIGIFGDWGVGKTSFMRQLEQGLLKFDDTPVLIPIWFNPWRFEKEEHLIIPFLKTISSGINRFEKEHTTHVGGLRTTLNNAAAHIGYAAVAFAYGLTAECKLGPVGFKLDTDKMADRDEVLQQRRVEAAAGYAHKLSSIYYDIINELKKAVTEDDFRLVVFIDDLDRCLPEKAIELLEAIKLFLDIPGYLFVLGVDKAVVKKGITHHYKHFEDQGEAGGKEKIISAEDYLEKMIQLPIDLPPIELGHKIKYIESLLDKASPYREYAALIEKGVGDNPRSLKRFINLASFLGRLADTIKLAETIKKVVDPNEVNEAFVSGLYLKWAIIVFRYPDEYNRIKGNPTRLLDYQRKAIEAKTASALLTGETISDSDGGLLAVLVETPHFPDNEMLISKFVHLTKVTKIVEREEDRPIPGTGGLKPGDWVPIPGGDFIFGDNKKPDGIEYDYDIDAFPVTQRQYQDFIDETDYDIPFVDEDWAEPYCWDQDQKTFPQGMDDHPVVLVSHEDAVAYCQWRGKKEGCTVQLPTEEEWEKAARGIDGREYPWGEAFDLEKCNTKESGIGWTVPVTRYSEGRSPYDVYDMAGNVWEWTDSFYDKDSDLYVRRGGSWFSDRDYARCSSRNSSRVGRNVDIGFRCVRSSK